MNHLVETASGYMLVSKPAKIVNTEEYICKVCPVPSKFSSKKIVKEHGIRKYNGRQTGPNQIWIFCTISF